VISRPTRSLRILGPSEWASLFTRIKAKLMTARPSPLYEAAIRAADPASREALARTINAYEKDFPDDFHWALSAPILFHLLNTIDVACRPEATQKYWTIGLADREPEGSA
jgi:hypothetical protein